MWFNKLLIEEKGKTVTIESDEEEEDPPTYFEEIEPEQETDEDISPVKWPKYVCPRKGKAKIPTDLDAIDNILITPSLLNGVPLEGIATEHIPTMKFDFKFGYAPHSWLINAILVANPFNLLS